MIRVSTLESFRRVCVSEYADQQELIDYIRAGQTSQPNPRMEAGTDWHAAIAGTPFKKYRFDPEAIEWAQEFTGPGLVEVTSYRVMDGWTVKGTCDHIEGLTIQDHKAKFSTPDPRDYEPSLQWRFYLWLFQAQRFQYNLWSFTGDPAETDYLKLRDVLSFSFWPYESMEADCRAWLRRFIEWAKHLNLLPYLEGSWTNSTGLPQSSPTVSECSRSLANNAG